MNIKIEKYGYFSLDNEPDQITPERTSRLYEIEFITHANGYNYCNEKEYAAQAETLVFYPIGTKRYSKGSFKCWFVHFMCSDSLINSCLPIKRKSLQITNPKDFSGYFQTIIDKMLSGSKADLISAMSVLLALIFVFAQENSTDNARYISGPILAKLELAKDFIETNYKNNIDWKMAADHINYSHIYFHNLFKKHYELTPHEYIVNLKITFAKKLLITTDYKIPQIAEESGFNNYTYFSYLFKQKTKMSPLTYRKIYLSL